jgi:hypothetical protein
VRQFLCISRIVSGIGSALVGCVLLAACGRSSTPTSTPAPTIVPITPTPTRAASAVQPTGTQAVAAALTGQNQLAGTSVASQSVPTTQATATRVAATQALPSLPPAAATSVAASPVSITGVQPSQSDATVMVRNTSTDRVNLSGWHLLVGTATAPLLDSGNLMVDPNQTITLHLSLGTSAPGNVYLGQASGALGRAMTPGQLVTLTDFDGDVASVYQIP